jgi:lysozyme
MIKGIDISHQNTINWAELSPDIKFVYAKATQGANFKDPMFNQYWQHLKTLNIFRGAYHFLTATDSAQEQVDNFLSFGIDFSKPNVLPPMLDIEDQVPASLNANIIKNKPAFIKLASDWINIIEAETKRKVIIYSYKDFFASYLNNKSWPDNPLWLAAYQTMPPGLPIGYKEWTIWQNSEYGKISGELVGGEFDMDVFNGTIEQLAAL